VEHSFAISPQVCARLILNFRLLMIRGRRECRAPDAPAAARVVVVSTRVSHYEYTGITRHSPRDGVTAYIELSPGTGLFCPRHSHGIVSRENLAPASGRQDHTILPSASGAFVMRAIRVHRIPPHVRDDREPPLCRDGTKSQ